jgi:hypothetical protein
MPGGEHAPLRVSRDGMLAMTRLGMRLVAVPRSRSVTCINSCRMVDVTGCYCMACSDTAGPHCNFGARKDGRYIVWKEAP